MRLPDFLIVGAMKSGTTSLFRWLGEQPDVWLPARKEPDFFTSAWSRGLDWYGSLFAGAPPGALTGEASVSYTNPMVVGEAASRIATTVPDARLVFVARDPVERLRSHYRHEVQRGRERRPLLEAVRSPGNAYVAHSSYATCIEPYLERLAGQMRVVRFEDLVGDPHPAWGEVCSHLGVPAGPRPVEARNATAEKAQFGPLLRRMWKFDAFRLLGHLPAPLRRVGKRALTKDGPGYQTRLVGSRAPLPDVVTVPLWEEAERLRALLGWQHPLWLPASGIDHAER